MLKNVNSLNDVRTQSFEVTKQIDEAKPMKLCYFEA